MHAARRYSLPVHPCPIPYISPDPAFACQIAHPPCPSSQVDARLLLGALRPPRSLFLQLIKPVTMVCGLMVWGYIPGARDRPPDPLRLRLHARGLRRRAQAIGSDLLQAGG